ncbi:flagellar biosynthetic protein FliQ [Verrucomicrobiota bacterium]|jgi:flagellar biosynthetic protein FliQ|nr:flagellar biosynthetic protein FliQ [Verrucomicrobiota bacterium]
MNIEQAVELLRGLITIVLMLISPILITAVVGGLVVSLIQSATSIQEQTLSFVPKLLAVALVLIVSAPWILRNLMQFTTSHIARMAEVTK